VKKGVGYGKEGIVKNSKIGGPEANSRQKKNNKENYKDDPGLLEGTKGMPYPGLGGCAKGRIKRHTQKKTPAN